MVTAPGRNRPEEKKAGPKVAPPQSFKLKEAMKATKAYENATGVPEVHRTEKKIKAKDHFDQAAVETALNEYAVACKLKPAIRTGITSHAPRVNGFVIVLAVDNEFLLDKLNEIHPRLLSFLVERLNNGYITLNIELYTAPADSTGERRLYTAKDKLEYFVELNPAVRELTGLFGLEIV